MDGWTNSSEDIVVAESLRTDPPMSLGVSPRSTFIRPSSDKNGSLALIYFRYYPRHNYYQNLIILSLNLSNRTVDTLLTI